MVRWGDTGLFSLAFLDQNLFISSLAVVPIAAELLKQSRESIQEFRSNFRASWRQLTGAFTRNGKTYILLITSVCLLLLRESYRTVIGTRTRKKHNSNSNWQIKTFNKVSPTKSILWHWSLSYISPAFSPINGGVSVCVCVWTCYPFVTGCLE